MNRYSLTHVPDPDLLRDLRTLLSQERVTTAELLAHLAEVDARRLYAAAGHPSMFAWCVEELHLSEDAAFKRIRAARTARQFPAIHGLLADGRLHLTAVVFLTPYLTPENAGELLAAATRRSKAGIEQFLAERFPRPDLPARIEALAPSPAFGELVPEPVESLGPGVSQLVPEPVDSPPPGTADFLPPPVTVAAKVAPLAPGRYGLQLTVAQGTYDKLRYADEARRAAASCQAIPDAPLEERVRCALSGLGRPARGRVVAVPRPVPRPVATAQADPHGLERRFRRA